MTYLNPEQHAMLLRPINGRRVSKDGKNFSHVEAYEIRAHLIRIFGFARWSEDVVSQELIFEEQGEKNNRAIWTVCYRSIVRLTVCAPDGTVLATYTEGATGDASNQPSRADAHDLALKTSQSQALKRCAYNLGDGYGLSLFNRGSLNALVVRTLVGVPEPESETDAVDAHITTALAPEVPADEPVRETSSRQAPRPTEDVPGPDDETGTAVANVTAGMVAPLDRIRNLLTFPPGMDLADRMRAVRDAMVLSLEFGLNETRIPTGQSLGAYLTEQLQVVNADIAAAAKEGS